MGNGMRSSYLTRILCSKQGRVANTRTSTRCALILLAAVVSLARGADPQPYRVELAPSGNKALDSTLKATSQLVALRTSAPVGPFGLIARARADVTRLTTLL